MKKALLSIAGFDPTSGAGVSLDIKVFQRMGMQGMGVLTGLTVQNTKDVLVTRCLSPDFVWEQYSQLRKDVTFSGIKVGMVCSRKILPVIRRILEENKRIPRIVDPVFRASSGTWLLEKRSIPDYIRRISGSLSLFTPNLEEAAQISGRDILDKNDLIQTAQHISARVKSPCLIKGFPQGQEVLDILYDGENFLFFKKKKLEKKVHGTGCFFSSSLLAYLVRGYSLRRSCSLASRLTVTARKRSLRLGGGQAIIQI